MPKRTREKAEAAYMAAEYERYHTTSSQLGSIKPVVGMALDIQDTFEVWSPGRLIQVKKRQGDDIDKKLVVVVRYDGWDSKWDEEIEWGSPRLARLYTYTRVVKCFCNIFPKLRTKPLQRELANLPGNSPKAYSTAWPCFVQLRMPHPTARPKVPAGELSAKDQLRYEPKLHVMLYAPHLLPQSLQKLNRKDGGRWFDCHLLEPWTDEPENFGVGQLRFEDAFAIAKADTVVKGTLPRDAFESGTLLRDEYLVKYVGGDGLFDGVLTKMRDDADHERLWERGASSDREPLTKKRKTSSSAKLNKFDGYDFLYTRAGGSSPIGLQSDFASANIDDSDTGSLHARSIRQIASPEREKMRSGVIQTPPSKAQGSSLEMKAHHSTSHHRIRRKTPSSAVEAKLSTDSPMSDDGEGSAYELSLPSPVKITEPLFPGVIRCQESSEWLATIASGGNNEIILGTFPTQTQAKQAIDVATGVAGTQVESDITTAMVLDNAAVRVEHVIEAFERHTAAATADQPQFSLHDWTLHHVRSTMSQGLSKQTSSVASGSDRASSSSWLSAVGGKKRKGKPRKVDRSSHQYID